MLFVFRSLHRPHFSFQFGKMLTFLKLQSALTYILPSTTSSLFFPIWKKVDIFKASICPYLYFGFEMCIYHM